MATATARRARLGPRQRGIQLGLVAVGLALVAVADAIAARLVLGADAVEQQAGAVLPVAGRALAGWAAGLAFRLQLAPAARTDEQVRTLLGVPLGFLSAWPLVLAAAPLRLVALLPGWLRTGALVELQPVAAVLLGVVVALSVTTRRTRR